MKSKNHKEMIPVLMLLFLACFMIYPAGRNLFLFAQTQMVFSFTESFSNNNYKDVVNTTANWNTVTGLVSLISGGSSNIWDTTKPTTTNAPTARANFSAVWTGSKMIVWGGQDSGGFKNNGGVYDPATNTWDTTKPTTTNAPSARGYHRAVWTGSKMIVWGGWNGSSDLNNGGIYDPATDTWDTTKPTTTGAPTARDCFSVVWDSANNKMIIWGGWIDASQSDVNNGGIWTLSTNTWDTTKPTTTGAPSARESHNAVWDSLNNKMLVWGGAWYDVDFEEYSCYNNGGSYNPATNTWDLTKPTSTGAPTARLAHSAVWDSTNNKMIVWGGDDSFDGVGYNNGGFYNPATNTWDLTKPTTTGAPNNTRHDAVYTGTKMIVWGGWSGAAYQNTGAFYIISASEYTTPAIARSLTVDNTPDTINSVILSVSATLPANTTITYEITANSGTNWYQVTPTNDFAIPVVGRASDLRWRANLSTADSQQTPLLDWVTITYSTAAVVTTSNWTALTNGNTPVRMGQSVCHVKFNMKTDFGTAYWKRFRIDKGITGVTTPVPDNKIEVQIWVENNNNGFWDANDILITKGGFVNGVCYLNMRQWQVTTTTKTYYIVYKLAGDIGGGQRAGVKIADSSYLEFENATCVGVQ
ncbi:MAG: hypothetical protein HY811_03845 [Planctomycetes bacterium]|nr:hypothetical protein [Planctomycetota bacterium]